MADKSEKKVVSIAITRERSLPVKLIVATGFKMRSDKATGLFDIQIEGNLQKSERILFDPFILRPNVDSLKKFVATSDGEPDNEAQKEDVTGGENPTYANIVNASKMEGRAETIFSVFSLFDWVEATRKSAGTQEITSVDCVVIISTGAFQKKFILELILLVAKLNNP